MNIEFDSDPMYGDKVIWRQSKYKFSRQKIATENASCKCWLLVMLDSVVRVSKKYYPQTLLEECKFYIKKTKLEDLINEDLDLSSSDDENYNKSENDTDFDNNE